MIAAIAGAGCWNLQLLEGTMREGGGLHSRSSCQNAGHVRWANFTAYRTERGHVIVPGDGIFGNTVRHGEMDYAR